MLIHGLHVVIKKSACCPFSSNPFYCRYLLFFISFSILFSKCWSWCFFFISFSWISCFLLVGCLFVFTFFSLSSHCNYLLEFISWWCVESVQTLYLTICKYLRQQPSTTDKLPVNKRRNEDILSQSFHHIASNSAIANSYSSLWLWDKLLTQPLSFQLFTLFFSFVTAFAISYFCTFVCVLVFIWYMCCKSLKTYVGRQLPWATHL